MARYYPKGSDPEILLNDPQFYHRFIEAQKFAYAQRTWLADTKFVKEAEELAVNMTTKRFTDEIIAQIKEKVRETKDYGADFGQVSYFN